MKNEPIRILHVVTVLNRGGLETMIMNHYRQIDRSKYQFDFLVHREGKHDYTDEVISLGGRIFTLPSFNPFNTNGYLSKLDDFFKHHKEYSVVHSHLDTLSAFPLKAAKKHGIKIRIAHAHNASQDKNLKYIIKYFAKKKIKKYATKLIGCGKAAGKWTFETEHFEIINNAIQVKDYAYNEIHSEKFKNKYSLDNNYVIGHIGRFNDTKNHIFMVEILEEVLKKRKDIKLLLVGEGPTKSTVISYAEKLGVLDNIVFAGLIENVNEVINAMDIFIMPSKYEGFPLVLVEAQTNGLKCIVSTNVSSEVNITGDVKFISLKDKELWVQEILNETKRRDYSEKIKENGFDVKENILKLERIYKGD